MVEDTKQRETCGCGSGPRPDAASMGSMAERCMGMAGKPHSGFLLMLPGAVLIAAGVLVLVEPAVLAWLAGGASVLAGLMLIVMAGFFRRLGGRMRRREPR